MPGKTTIEVREDLASEASIILERLGLDLDDAVKLFLRRCILEQKLPFNINDSVAPVAQAQTEQRETHRTSGGKITQDMVECVWNVFENYREHGGDLRRLADRISSDTGMNAGSAFIYLVILDNLVEGHRNTRNMKMRDLEFYISCIQKTYGDVAYRNALSSLGASIPYWETQPLGNFPDKVRLFLANQTDVHH